MHCSMSTDTIPISYLIQATQKYTMTTSRMERNNVISTVMWRKLSWHMGQSPEEKGSNYDYLWILTMLDKSSHKGPKTGFLKF